MVDNLQEWQGEFGKQYTDRNQYNYKTRVEGFERMIPEDACNILEVGCNYGNNLAALESLEGVTAVGVEPNEYAADKGITLGRNIVCGSAYNIPFPDNYFDLVLTCGLLIHIPPERLAEAMAEIKRVTKKYILTIEYMGSEGMKEYRGMKNMMWKRGGFDWGGKLISIGDLDESWDNANYQLWEMPR